MRESGRARPLTVPPYPCTDKPSHSLEALGPDRGQATRPCLPLRKPDITLSRSTALPVQAPSPRMPHVFLMSIVGDLDAMKPSHIPGNYENPIGSSEPASVSLVLVIFSRYCGKGVCSAYVMTRRDITDSHQKLLEKVPNLPEGCPSSSETALIPSTSVGSRLPAS